jgi:hypothetical protein
MHLPGTVIAEKVVEPGDGPRKIPVSHPEDDINALMGMRFVEAEPVLGGTRRLRLRGAAEGRCRNQQKEQSAGERWKRCL